MNDGYDEDLGQFVAATSGIKAVYSDDEHPGEVITCDVLWWEIMPSGHVYGWTLDGYKAFDRAEPAGNFLGYCDSGTSPVVLLREAS